MVFDELRLCFDVSWSETSAIHYLRFGTNDGATNTVVRNMLTFTTDVGSATGEMTNAIIGMRLGSNTVLEIRPFGGTIRVPTLADNLTLITLTDNSSVSFGSEGGTRLNMNTLYRMANTSNKLSVFQSDGSNISLSGVIKVYGIKYPTA